MISSDLSGKLENYVVLHAESMRFLLDLQSSAGYALLLGIESVDHQLLYTIYDATYTRSFVVKPPHVPEEWVDLGNLEDYEEQDVSLRDNACQHVANIYGGNRRKYRRWLDKFVSSLSDRPPTPAP